MAIQTLLRSESLAAFESPQLQPLYLKGCKITRGAGITLPAPSLATALLLVAARRASSRILEPIAATQLQRAWARHLASRRDAAARDAALLARRSTAATRLQAAWRAHALAAAAAVAATKAAAATEVAAAWRRCAARALLDERRRAQTRIASAARGRAARLAYRRRLAQISGPLARIQAAARGRAARRRLAAALAAVRVVQSTWRRVRCQVLRRRLARAANALRQGGRLAKYRRRRGGKHERHARFAWVSADLQQLMWAPVAHRFDEDAPKLRSIPMSSITAVTEGVKTPLLKKMERRAAEPHRVLSFSHKPLHLHKPLALDEGCAFSIICRERVVDFYAESVESRDAWLRDLKTALSYAHTYDHKAAMAAVQKLSASEPARSSDSDSDDDE